MKNGKEKTNDAIDQFLAYSAPAAKKAMAATPTSVLTYGHLAEELSELIIAQSLHNRDEEIDAILDMTPLLCALYYQPASKRQNKIKIAATLSVQKYFADDHSVPMEVWVRHQAKRGRRQWSYAAVSQLWSALMRNARSYSFTYHE